MENRITFKIKTGYFLELVTPETKKLLGSAKNKITKDENDKNLPHSENAEVVFVVQSYSRISSIFVPNKPLFNYQIFHLKIFHF